MDLSIDTFLLFAGVCINAGVFYRIGQIQQKVDSCENYKVTPRVDINATE